MERPRTSSSLSRLRDRERHSRERSDDLLAVKAAVFDKNFAGVDSTDDHAGEVQTGNIALERARVESGFIRLRIKLHAKLPQEIEIGMVAGESEDVHRGKRCLDFFYR